MKGDLLLHMPNGGPAFPINGAEESWEETGGMSLRDWFAGHAIQAVMAKWSGETANNCAQYAYEIADAMLEARKK